MRVTRKQLKNILESMVKDYTKPSVDDFFDNLDMRRNLPSGIKKVDPSAISALRSGDYTLRESFAKLHEYTKIEMESGIFGSISDDVITLKYTSNRNPFLVAADYTAAYQAMHSSPPPAGFQDLLNNKMPNRANTASPPGAILDYTYPGLNSAGTNLNSYDLVMKMFIDKAGANPIATYNAIQNCNSHALSDADRVEVGFAGFLAASPGVSNVTHTAQNPGVDNTAEINGKLYKFEQKKAEGTDPNRNYNTTPVYNQTDKFYVFICTDRGYLIRSDILAVFEKITIPVDKLDPQGYTLPVGPEQVSADAQLLTPTQQLIVDATGTKLFELIKSVANSGTPLSNWWSQKIDSFGHKNTYSSSQLNSMTNLANIRGVNNAYASHMRALVLSIGVPQTLGELAQRLPSLTGPQIRGIANRIKLNQTVESVFNREKMSNKKQQFLNRNPYNITSSDSEEVISFAMAYHNAVNNNVMNLAKSMLPSTLSQKTRLGEPGSYISTSSSVSGASNMRVKVENEQAITDQKLITILNREDIPNIDKSIVIGKIVRQISSDLTETVYDQVTKDPNKKQKIDNAICDLLKGEIQIFDLEKNYDDIDPQNYDFYSKYPILSRFAAAFGARRSRQHHVTLQEIAENCLTPEQLYTIKIVTTTRNLIISIPDEENYDYIPTGLPFDDEDDDSSFFNFGDRGSSGKSLYESVLLDLMGAVAKKQRASKQPKKIKLTKRQLNSLLREIIERSK